MKNLATGVDILEMARFEKAIERHGDRILQRVFTPKELSQVGKNKASLAARFAAKEAVAKALCTGIGPVTWQEIEVLRGPDREPILYLHGAAQSRAADMGLHLWSVSLSHSATAVVAFVVAMG